MRRYSEEFKERIVRKMSPPNARTVAQVHREMGVSDADPLCLNANDEETSADEMAAATKKWGFAGYLKI